MQEEVLLLLYRLVQDKESFIKEKNAISEIDPLNHFAEMETARMNNYRDSSDIKVVRNIKNEFQEETALAIALQYKALNFNEEALLTLLVGRSSPKNEIWKAYLYLDAKPEESVRLLDKMLNSSVNFVFPYRRETVPVLEWAIAQNDSWKLKYYLAQNYIAVGLKSKGVHILKELGDKPDADVFYRFRAKLSEVSDGDSEQSTSVSDLNRALELKPNDWKIWEESILLHQKFGNDKAAYDLSKKAFKKYIGNYNIGLAHAKSLLNTQRFSQVLKVLKNIQLLPYEHASESRSIYERCTFRGCTRATK